MNVSIGDKILGGSKKNLSLIERQKDDSSFYDEYD